LPCGQGLQSAHLRFNLPCGHPLHSAQSYFTLPCEHRFRTLSPIVHETCYLFDPAPRVLASSPTSRRGL